MDLFTKSLSHILNLDHTTLQNQLFTSSHDALLKIVATGTDPDSCMLFTEPLQSSRNSVPNSGDLLVGFQAREDVAFDVVVGTDAISSYRIPKNKFVYAINDTYPYPLISSRFVQLYINVTAGNRDDVQLVYGFLANCDTRKFVAQNGWQVDEFYIKYGTYHGKEKPKPDNVPVYDMPKLRTEIPVEKYMQMAKERSDVLLPDFARAMWHPERVRLWCLPHDDAFAICAPTRGGDGLTRMWLDDVLMIDGFDFEYTVYPSKNELRCNIDALLTAHNMRRVGAMRYITYSPGEGMHSHKDAALEGGDMTFIVYLDDNSEGHIVFEQSGVRVVPRKNRCLLFGVDVMHHVLPCREAKSIITGEAVFWYKE
jgi:hypothetical protein